MFVSYHWNEELLGAEDRVSFDCLTAGEATIDDVVAPLLALLRSDDSRARGLAFDHFFHEGTTDAVFPCNPWQAHERELLWAARRELASATVDGELPTGEILPAANHASALLVLWRLSDGADASDLDAIERALAPSAGGVIKRVACQAAGMIFYDSRIPAPALLARLRALALEATADDDPIGYSAVSAIATWHGDGTDVALQAISAHGVGEIAAVADTALGLRSNQK